MYWILKLPWKNICCIALWNTFLGPSKSRSKLLIVWSLQFTKTMFEKLLLNKEMEWCRKPSIRMFSKLSQYGITWFLFAGYLVKDQILCSVYSIWFMKYVFFAKIWFVKTSIKIVKYESRVVKSNPDFLFILKGFTLLNIHIAAPLQMTRTPL